MKEEKSSIVATLNTQEGCGCCLLTGCFIAIIGCLATIGALAIVVRLLAK